MVNFINLASKGCFSMALVLVFCCFLLVASGEKAWAGQMGINEPCLSCATCSNPGPWCGGGCITPPGCGNFGDCWCGMYPLPPFLCFCF